MNLNKSVLLEHFIGNYLDGLMRNCRGWWHCLGNESSYMNMRRRIVISHHSEKIYEKGGSTSLEFEWWDITFLPILWFFIYEQIYSHILKSTTILEILFDCKKELSSLSSCMDHQPICSFGRKHVNFKSKTRQPGPIDHS